MSNSYWRCILCQREIPDEPGRVGFNGYCECGGRMVWRFRDHFLDYVRKTLQLYEQ